VDVIQALHGCMTPRIGHACELCDRTILMVALRCVGLLSKQNNNTWHERGSGAQNFVMTRANMMYYCVYGTYGVGWYLCCAWYGA
jgi:hypothetical protein